MILRSHVLRGIISLGKVIIYEWPAEKQGPISLCFITIQNEKGERLALSRLQKMGEWAVLLCQATPGQRAVESLIGRRYINGR